MTGVNEELMPIMRMTFPAGASGMSLADAPLGCVAFHSWILLFGWIPIDRHALTLTEVRDGFGFREDSSSWSQRQWRHERTLEDIDGGCIVRDRLTFSARIPWFEPVLAGIVRTLFQHRHGRLRRRYGAAEMH